MYNFELVDFTDKMPWNLQDSLPLTFQSILTKASSNESGVYWIGSNPCGQTHTTENITFPHTIYVNLFHLSQLQSHNL